MQFSKSEVAQWCEHCDRQKGHNLISLWGHISSGKEGDCFQQDMHNEYVQVTFYLCDECVGILYLHSAKK